MEAKVTTRILKDGGVAYQIEYGIQIIAGVAADQDNADLVTKTLAAKFLGVPDVEEVKIETVYTEADVAQLRDDIAALEIKIPPVKEPPIEIDPAVEPVEGVKPVG